jgi:hypothetical protein
MLPWYFFGQPPSKSAQKGGAMKQSIQNAKERKQKGEGKMARRTKIRGLTLFAILLILFSVFPLPLQKAFGQGQDGLVLTGIVSPPTQSKLVAEFMQWFRTQQAYSWQST